MKKICVLVLTLVSLNYYSQSEAPWSMDYEITLDDFQGAETEINSDLNTIHLYPGTTMNFSFFMSTYEFMFTKNFNSKVITTFNRSSASISASDTASALVLVKYARYSFDLSELYTRKFRKELFENKKTFTDVNSINEMYQRVNDELNAESSRVMKLTDLGRNEELLMEEHKKVIEQINTLPDYCYDCKPIKKKKKKKSKS